MHSTALDLIAITKPRVTLLCGATCGVGIAAAGGAPGGARVAATIAGTTLAVAAANALNCWWERDSDRLMARTASRPLPAGRLAPSLALAFGLVLAAVALGALASRSTPLAAALAAFAIASYVLIYTPLKRRTPAALLVGAIPGALPPLVGAAGTRGALEAAGLALFVAIFVWQVPHFLAIALARRDEYARAGLAALPVVRGDRVARRRLVAWAALLVPASLLPGLAGAVRPGYLAVALGLGLAFFALATSRVRPGAVFAASLAHLTALCVALLLC
jgi:protoheme IX farnesyltransferase